MAFTGASFWFRCTSHTTPTVRACLHFYLNEYMINNFCFLHYRHLHFPILCPQQNVGYLFRTVPPANRRSTRLSCADYPPVKTVCPSVHDGTISESVHETTLHVDGR